MALPPLVELLSGDVTSLLIALAGIVAGILLLRRGRRVALLICAGSFLWLVAEAFSFGFTSVHGILKGQMSQGQLQLVEMLYFLTQSLAFALGIALLLTATLIALRRRGIDR
jgi:hypothetical protein